MANTADILGEQETLDKLVAHSLEDFEDDRITKVRRYAFYYNDGLKTVSLPNAATLDNGAFRYCYNLEKVNLSNTITIIPTYVFGDCYKLNNVGDFSSVERLYDYSLYRCYSLNNIDLSNIKNIQTYALEQSGFGTIVLPKCTSLNRYFIRGSRISTVDLHQTITIVGNTFREAYSLVHLILRSNNLYPLNSTSAFTNTPIADGLGWIYVPSDLVDTYKTASNWSTYANQIVSIDEYPKALDGETITDSWDEIFQAEDNDTYKTKYSVGDTKYLIVGGTYVLMQIIAFDRDILSSNGTSTAKITWLTKGASFTFPMNFTSDSTGGWAECECRKFLNDTIYKQIPENVKGKILAVNKTYSPTIYAADTTTVSDKLWIPSQREILGDKETSGITYTDFFSDSLSRIKVNGLTKTNCYWQLRSIYNTNGYSFINTSGGTGYGAATIINEIALGFCT